MKETAPPFARGDIVESASASYVIPPKGQLFVVKDIGPSSRYGSGYGVRAVYLGTNRDVVEDFGVGQYIDSAHYQKYVEKPISDDDLVKALKALPFAITQLAAKRLKTLLKTNAY